MDILEHVVRVVRVGADMQKLRGQNWVATTQVGKGELRDHLSSLCERTD